jgi:hypothetical protein
MKNSNVTSRKRINFSITLGLIFGLVSISTSYAADISVSVSPTNPFRDFPVASSGGSYQVDVNANGGDSVVQLYSGVSAGTFNSAFAPNPANHVNENDDYLGLSSRITGTVISGPHVIRVTSYAYWTGRTSPTQTYTLSYTGFTSATEPPTQAVIYYEPILSPYLVSTTAPQIHIKDEELVCTAGNYQAGIADRGNIPTDGKDAYKPSNFTYNLLINGQSQRSLVINSSESSVSWNRSKISSEAVVFCSVAVTWNSLTVEGSSTGNTDGMKPAQSRQREDVVKADKVYFEVLSGNFEKYKKVLVDNRATWRKQIDAIRTNYYDTLNRIKANGGSKMVTDTSTALKIMIAAQKKSAADYAASKPAALVAKDAANKAALISRDAAIAKANATYGTFIESIGYGVLIP